MSYAPIDYDYGKPSNYAFAESITEGDLRWEKAAGDSVAEDEVNMNIF